MKPGIWNKSILGKSVLFNYNSGLIEKPLGRCNLCSCQANIFLHHYQDLPMMPFLYSIYIETQKQSNSLQVNTNEYYSMFFDPEGSGELVKIFGNHEKDKLRMSISSLIPEIIKNGLDRLPEPQLGLVQGVKRFPKEIVINDLFFSSYEYQNLFNTYLKDSSFIRKPMEKIIDQIKSLDLSYRPIIKYNPLGRDYGISSDLSSFLDF